jgi:hypothetical protein
VFSFCNRLSDSLYDPLEFLEGTHYPDLNEFQFGRDGAPHFFHGTLMRIDAFDGRARFGVVADQVELTRNGVKEDTIVLRKSFRRREQG